MPRLQLQTISGRIRVVRATQVATALLTIGLVAALPAAAAGSFDGVYKGSQTTVRNNGSGECANLDRPTTLVVRDNHFTRKWAADLEVDIAPDGSFEQRVIASQRPLRTASIKGKIANGTLEADIGTDLCSAHLSLKKS
jgi:hypothetical protein